MKYPANVIRLQLSIATNPPVAPVDIVTAEPPKAWRGGALDVQLAIFDNRNAAVDLSNIAWLEVDIFPSSYFANPPVYDPYTPQPFPPLPPAPLIFVTIPGDDLAATISFEDWIAGVNEQAVASFSANQMAQLDLADRESADFYLVVHALTRDSRRIVYGATRFPVFESGAQGVYLPNNLAPLEVPAETILYIGPNQQMPFSETIDVEGTIVIDGGMMLQV